MLKSVVLVVDDDEDNAMVLEAALESRGFVVKVARSCHDARAVLEATPVDALVTDYSLGDGDALDLLSSLGERKPRVAVVVSGHGSPEDKARTRAAGFDGHLLKPIVLDQLDQILRTALTVAV